MHVVPRQLGGEQGIEEFLHLRIRQCLPRLDRPFTGERHRDALVLISRRPHQVTRALGQFGHHLAEAAFCVEPGVGIGHRVHDRRVASEHLHLEASPGEKSPNLVDFAKLRARQPHREGKEQPLCLGATRLIGLHQTIEQHPLVRRVLIDNEEPLSRLRNETLPRTVLTSGTTLAVLVALLLVGPAVIRDFSTVLILGVVIGTYSSIFVASPALVEIRKRLGDGDKDRKTKKKRRPQAASV